MATSRCLYFKVLGWFFFSPGLIPTCDNPKYSQKFLQHRRDVCKRRSKLDREHWLDSSADMLEGKLQFFIQKVERSSNHTVQTVQMCELRDQQHHKKLFPSAAPGWELAKGRCNSLLVLIIVIVQICFCKITWDTLHRGS